MKKSLYLILLFLPMLVLFLSQALSMDHCGGVNKGGEPEIVFGEMMFPFSVTAAPTVASGIGWWS